MPVLSVVLPTYNEAANIGPMLEALRVALPGIDAEFVVVDDDSPDGTADNARAADPAAKVIVRTEERGLGTAVVEGFRQATGEYVAVMDTDFQHPPEVMARMLAAAQASKADLVVGSRYVKGGSDGAFNIVRRTISKGAALLSKIALPPVRKHKISDPMSGLFLVRRDRLDLDELDPQGYKILLEVLAKADIEKVVEVGYEFQSRRDGDSKLGPLVILQYLLHLAMLGLKHPENQRVFRFGLVGLSGVVVNLGILWLLTEKAGLFYLFSAAISIEASIVTNFLLNDKFTFHDKREGHFFHRLARFNAVSLGALLINLTTLFILTEIFQIHYLVSEAIAIVVSFGANFLGNMHWTYGGANRFQLRQTLARASPHVPLLLIVAASGYLFFDDIGRADEIYFDEHYYISVAYQMGAGVWEDPCWLTDELDHRPLNFEHPPLAKLIIAWSATTFDPDHQPFPGCRQPDSSEYRHFTNHLRDKGDPVAWRAPSAVFGMMSVAFAGLATARIFNNPTAGALAGAFVAMDGVIFTSSRLAILDIFATGFTMMAVYFATFPGKRGVIGSAIALGLGFACKYTTVFAGPAVLLLLLWTQWRHGRLNRRMFDASAAAYILIPNWILLATYIPWWRIWVPKWGVWGALTHWFDIMKEGIRYGTSLQSGHNYGIPSYMWFADHRPTFYYQMSNAYGIAGLNRYVYAVGNPILWWAAAATILAVIVRYVSGVWHRARARGEGILTAAGKQPMWLQAAFIAAMIPALTYVGFLALSRETFLFYMTIMVPLLAVPLAGVMMQLWDKGNMVGRIVVPATVLLIVAAFLHYYPVTAASDVRVERFEAIMDAVPWMRT